MKHKKLRIYKLDLHGIKHKDVPNKVDTFIRHNKNNFPVEIITGNSITMIKLVQKVIRLYNLKMTAKSIKNVGSYIVDDLHSPITNPKHTTYF